MDNEKKKTSKKKGTKKKTTSKTMAVKKVSTPKKKVSTPKKKTTASSKTTPKKTSTKKVINSQSKTPKKTLPSTNTPKVATPKKKTVKKKVPTSNTPKVVKTKKKTIPVIENINALESDNLFDINISSDIDKTTVISQTDIDNLQKLKQKKKEAKEVLQKPKEEVVPPKQVVKKSKTKRNVIKYGLVVCIIIALGFFLNSAYNIYKWYQDNKNIEKLTDKINKNTEIKDVNEDDKEIVIPEAGIKEPEENPYWDYIKMSLIDVDLNELKKTNPDTVGWVQVNGTNINYPFVQTNNNDYYLTHSFDKKWNDAGWVFLDYRNNINDLGRNTIIYAHGRFDGAMFGSLKNILKSKWYNNLDNHVIKVSLNGTSSLWQVFSVYHIPTTNDYIRTAFLDDNDFKEFVDMLKQRSFYTFNTEVLGTDKIITLSTCYNDDEKMVMHAKLIKYAS